MKFAPKDGQTAGFCTTAVCISCPRREGDAPIAIPFGSQPNAFPCGRVFKTTGTTYTTRTTILISHGLSRMSTDDTENDYMIESTLKSGLNLLFYGSALARARPVRGRRTPAQGRMSIANGTLGKTRPDGTRPAGESGNGCNDTSFGTTNNHPDKNRFESCSFLMHFARNPICFAALEGSFARKIRISYTQKMETYTQSFTRNCQ